MVSYYYAGGERIEIATDTRWIAVDVARARAAGLSRDVDRVTSTGARSLPGGVALLEKSALDDVSLKRLTKAGVIQPVYRRKNALIVPLPEIRVELDPGQRKAALVAIGKAPHPTEISQDSPDQLVVHTKSGSGEDAMRVANYIYETAHPAAAAVRFVQVTPGPKPKR